MVLRRFVGDKTDGFYVDIGAHHPMRYSNTASFYISGWRGINIDADPTLMELFSQFRPRDINIVAGVGTAEHNETFFVFNEPALNTFDKKLAEERVRGEGGYEVVSQRLVGVRTLASILDERLPLDTHIDFMTIDVEGRDYDVLGSNDWDRYRPEYVLVEDGDVTNVGDVQKSRNAKFLRTKGYEAVAKTLLTVIFRRYE